MYTLTFNKITFLYSGKTTELGASKLEHIRALHETLINSSAELVSGCAGGQAAPPQARGARDWRGQRWWCWLVPALHGDDFSFKCI